MKPKSGIMKHHYKKVFEIRNLSSKENSSGFTIIELLIYMGIFSILLVITLQMFGAIFDAQLESQVTSSVSSDSKFIMGRFTRDLNKASSITTPALPGTSSATLTLVVDSQSLTYSSSSSGNLILENISAGTSDQLNSNDTKVSNVSFLRLDGGGKDVVQITFTLTSETTRSKGKEVKTFQTSAGLR